MTTRTKLFWQIGVPIFTMVAGAVIGPIVLDQLKRELSLEAIVYASPASTPSEWIKIKALEARKDSWRRIQKARPKDFDYERLRDIREIYDGMFQLKAVEGLWPLYGMLRIELTNTGDGDIEGIYADFGDLNLRFIEIEETENMLVQENVVQLGGLRIGETKEILAWVERNYVKAPGLIEDSLLIGFPDNRANIKIISGPRKTMDILLSDHIGWVFLVFFTWISASILLLFGGQVLWERFILDYQFEKEVREEIKKRRMLSRNSTKKEPKTNSEK
jgi:hypothetical protein